MLYSGTIFKPQANWSSPAASRVPYGLGVKRGIEKGPKEQEEEWVAPQANMYQAKSGDW